MKSTAWLSLLAAALAAAQTPPIAQYCTGCHNDRLKTGGFSWPQLDLAHPESNLILAETVIRKLRAGMMPPPGLPRPDAATTRNFIASLEASVDQWAALHPNPGRPALHRLNRAEYANSIRDLLAVNIDAAALLPADDLSHGFDNMADALTVSPALMDGYIRAAGKISRQATGAPVSTPAMATYRIPRVVSQIAHVDGTPFGTRGGLAVLHDFPADGEYSFRIVLYSSLDGPVFGQNQGEGQKLEIAVNGERVALLDINPLMQSTDDLRTGPIKLKAGTQKVSAAFIQQADGPLEDDSRPLGLSLVDLNNAAFFGVTSLPHLSEFTINGPFNPTPGVADTSSRRKVFTCHPTRAADELPCAKSILARLARLAYRRPVSGTDVEDLLTFYRQGTGFESGVTTAIQALLSSPEFVFRFERTSEGIAPGTNYRLGGLELASRLSYFLWSSAPDEELLTVASQGKLKEPATLERQVRRMLADRRSETLSTRFAAQWLHLQNLRDVQPDPFLFPDFTRNLAQSMRRETEMLFQSMVREDRGVLGLLTSDYTFVDELLARHYGIPNVLGSRFRRVAIADENRRGILGHGSILTLTSLSGRTSPVARGKFILGVVLGMAPPVPPPSVPPLPEKTPGSKPKSVRVEMEEHRANEPCRSCHQLMDPIGFSLERFDAVGAWRNKDGGTAVDSSGLLFDGTKLDGPVSLRQAILKRPEAFLGAFTENLLAYGLGRVLETSDMPATRTIMRDAARNDNRFSSFILGVVKSAPFQMRQAE